MQTKTPFYQILKNDIGAYQTKIVNYYHVLWQNKQTVFLPLSLFLAFVLSSLCLSYIFNMFQEEKTMYLNSQTQEQLNTNPSEDAFSKLKEEKEKFKKKFSFPVKNSHGHKALDTIKRQLKFDHFNIKIEDEKIVDKKLGIYAKKIVINTKSSTDRKFYQLIDRLHHQMPGLINFSNLSIKKVSHSFGNKDYIVFEGKIECHWIKPKSY